MSLASSVFTAERRWPALLDCAFAERRRRTVLTRLRFEGPLRVQRLFYPEKDRAGEDGAIPCHCCLLHPPGGLVSGDSLDIRCAVGPGAHCLVTTPAAGKVYRTDSHRVPQRQSCEAVLEDGVLEWFPQENIVFSGADVTLSSCFHLRGQCRLLGWEILCLGRPAGGEGFAEGKIRQWTRITQDGVPILQERMALEGGDAFCASPAALHRHAVSATFFACGRKGNAEDGEALRRACSLLQDRTVPALFPAEGVREERAGATFRGGVLTARYLGGDSAGAKRFCLAVWGITRPLLLRREICAPRIWHT